MNAIAPPYLAELMEARFEPGCCGDNQVQYLLIDSRMVFEPSGTVFFALKGSRHDGHQFISDLFEKGIRNFVIAEKYKIGRAHV